MEAGRGLAAALVMISHVGTTHPVPLDGSLLGFLGSAGVGFFFVLSGFIMLHIHRADLNNPAASGHFAWRRLGRILPTYYVVLIGLLAINHLLQKNSSQVPLSLGFLVEQLLLLPGHQLFVGPAWTLRHELFFYLVFMSLLINRKVGVAIFLIWLGLLLYHMLGVGMWTTEVDRAPDVYLHHLNIYFFEGLAAAMALKAGRIWVFMAVNTALAAVLLGLSTASTPSTSALLWSLGLFPAYAAVLALFIGLSLGRFRAPRLLVWLGEISYSLYLAHLAVFIVLRGVDHAVGRPLDQIWLVRAALQCAIAIGVAAALHHFIEKPALNWINSRRSVFGLYVGRPNRIASA